MEGICCCLPFNQMCNCGVCQELSSTNTLALFFLSFFFWLSFFPLFCPFSFFFLLLRIHQPGCLREGTWTSLTSADSLSLRSNRNRLQFQLIPKHSRLSRKQLERDSKGTISDKILTIRKCIWEADKEEMKKMGRNTLSLFPSNNATAVLFKWN